MQFFMKITNRFSFSYSYFNAMIISDLQFIEATFLIIYGHSLPLSHYKY